MTQQERDEIRALVLSFSTKISDLPEVEALQDDDYVVVVQNDGSKKHSKKATLESLLELIKVYYPDHNGAKYQGVAHPSDTNVQVPVGTDGFWFAIDAGVYTNYGGIIVENAPKAILYNVETQQWTSQDLWGDINGSIAFRLKQSTSANAWDTYRIPVIPNRDYLLTAIAKPTGSLGSVVVTEYTYDGTLVKTTELEHAQEAFVPQSTTDYIKVTLGYNVSNPIDKDLSSVILSAGLKTLVEGLYNFIVDVIQEEYEGRLDGIDSALVNISQRLGTAEGNITSLLTDVGSISADLAALVLRVAAAEGSISLLEETVAPLPGRISALELGLSGLGDDLSALTGRVGTVEGDIDLLELAESALRRRVSDAEGNITDLQVDAFGIHADIENAQGDILNLDIRADALELDMTNAQGDILDLDIRASGISTRLENAEGDIDELSITAEGLEQRITNAEGDVHTLQSTATTLESQITATDGRVSTLRQTVDEIDARVENAEGDVAGLAIEAHRIDLYAQSISESLGDYETFANGIMRGLQDQLDGVVDTYFYDYMPVHEDATGAPDSQVPLIEITIEGVTVPCEPYASWYNTDHGGTAQEVNTERLKHLGDVFYDNKSGYAFRFSNTGTEENPVFAWVEITDSAVIKALADAARAQDTADHKRRVFVYSVTYPTPYAPYDVGDLWVKPVTVGTGASAQNTTELYRCITARERTTDVFPFNPAVNTDTTSEYCDWAPADSYGMIVNKANLEVMSNAIVGQVTQITYNADGTISDQSSSAIQQTAGQIRLQVANGAIDTAVTEGGKIAAPLLATGIDIVQGDITLVANHISLKNQSDITGLELITLGESPNQKVVIDVGSLNVSGIFTTSAWDNSSLVNPGVKQQLLASAAGTAEQMLGTALYGSGGTQQQPTGGVYKALNPITTALTENTTVIAGGLMMSTALVLGGLTGPDDSQGNPTWEPWSGMFGVYDPTVGAGGGVAAWYGGTNVDAFTIPNWDTMTDAQKAAAWSQYRYARTLFRMDGSGYLANGEISWSNQGSLVIHGASIESTVLENSVTFGSTQITIQDIIELKSWFVKQSYTDSQGNTRYAIKLATGTAAGTIAGFYTDGFISAGGLSSGGGASGTTIEAVWGTLTNDAPATPTTTTKIAAAHIPIGSGLEIQNGVIVVTAQGTVTGIKIGSTTYTPASGSTTVDISAGIPTVPTVVSAFTNDAGYITSSDIPSSWAWSTITNTPTTLSGYGITDATISNGVVTLGSSTITPVTGVSVGGSGHTNDLAITAGGSTSYITVPFATTASKLSTVSKTAWGQTYWTSGGVPDSISGNMSSVGNITMTGSISGATTISASSSVTSPIFYLNANTYFVLDSSGYVHLVTPSGKGFYCDGFVSAGGISTGGGTSGIDLAAMWASLQNNDIGTSGPAYEHRNDKIHTWHLPACGTGLSYTTDSAGLATGINVSFPVSSVSKGTATSGGAVTTSSGAVTIQFPDSLPASDVYSWAKQASKPSYSFSEITGTASTTQIPDLSGTYVTLATAQTISGKKTFSSALKVSGRIGAGGDDEGIVVGFASNDYAAVCLGSPTGVRSVFYHLSGNVPFWRYNNGTTSYDITHPAKSGAIALTSDFSDYLPLSAGSTKPLTGKLHIADGLGIESEQGSGLLCYKPTGWSGVSTSQWGLGAGDVQGVIRSNDNDLLHYRWGVNYTIYDSSNSNKNDVSWACSTLGVNGNATFSTAGIVDVQHGNAADVNGIDSTGLTLRRTVAASDAYGIGLGLLAYNNQGFYIIGGSSAFSVNGYYNSTYSTYLYIVGGAGTNPGFIGIGTTTPTRKLDVSGTFNATTLYEGGTALTAKYMYGRAKYAYNANELYDMGVWLVSGGASNYPSTSSNGTIMVFPYRNVSGNSTPDYASQIFIPNGDDSAPYLYYRTGLSTSWNAWVKVWGTNNAGAGYAWACTTLEASSTIHASTGIYSDGYITAGSASSREFKDNVQNMSLEYARNIIMSSRPITFQWNTLAHSLCDKYEGDGIGFIAQEAEQLMPFAISPIFEKYKRLDYTAYISPLVRVAQSHEMRIRELEDEVGKLREENKQLKARLTN